MKQDIVVLDASTATPLYAIVRRPSSHPVLPGVSRTCLCKSDELWCVCVIQLVDKPLGHMAVAFKARPPSKQANERADSSQPKHCWPCIRIMSLLGAAAYFSFIQIVDFKS